MAEGGAAPGTVTDAFESAGGHWPPPTSFFTVALKGRPPSDVNSSGMRDWVIPSEVARVVEGCDATGVTKKALLLPATFVSEGAEASSRPLILLVGGGALS